MALIEVIGTKNASILIKLLINAGADVNQVDEVCVVHLLYFPTEKKSGHMRVWVNTSVERGYCFD